MSRLAGPTWCFIGQRWNWRCRFCGASRPMPQTPALLRCRRKAAAR